MIKQEISIDGKVFTVRSSTPGGVEAAIAALKKSVKRYNKQNKDKDNDAI